MTISLQVIDMIRDGFFTPGNENEFKDLVDMLLHHDRFLTLADFRAYVTSQELVSEVYRDQARYCQSGLRGDSQKVCDIKVP